MINSSYQLIVKTLFLAFHHNNPTDQNQKNNRDISYWSLVGSVYLSSLSFFSSYQTIAFFFHFPSDSQMISASIFVLKSSFLLIDPTIIKLAKKPSSFVPIVPFLAPILTLRIVSSCLFHFPLDLSYSKSELPSIPNLLQRFHHQRFYLGNQNQNPDF
jgi:hypothetical protein